MQIKVEDLLDEVGSYAKENSLLKAQLKAYERRIAELEEQTNKEEEKVEDKEQ